MTCGLIDRPGNSSHEGENHDDTAGEKDDAGDADVVGEHVEFGKNEIPVVSFNLVTRGAAEKDQAGGSGVVDVGGGIEEGVTGPPGADRGGEAVAISDGKGHRKDEGHGHLAQGSTKGVEDGRGPCEEHVACFVEDEVDVMNEAGIVAELKHGGGEETPAVERECGDESDPDGGDDTH